jgi:hypothetical protein
MKKGRENIKLAKAKGVSGEYIGVHYGWEGGTGKGKWRKTK